MNVTFYNYTGDSRKADKDLEAINENPVSCKVQDGCTLINPILKLNYNSDYFNADYFYISDWKRYYKATSPTVDEGGRMYITGVVDPIKSFWPEISTSKAMITRQENAGITIVPDEMLPIQQNNETVYVQDIGDRLIGNIETPQSLDLYYVLTYK